MVKEVFDFRKVKLPKEILNDIVKLDDKKEYVDLVKDALYTPTAESGKAQLQEAYEHIMSLLKEYCDLKEEYYNIIALWIIGTYFHRDFPSYAYLYFNAMRGSGKSRLMNLVTTLAHSGQMLNSLTEAVLFRTGGTLGIDEFEGMERKGGEALRELLNSGYKRGTKVKRMRKKKSPDGEEMVVEEFDVYRPIVMANIAGIENVLEDRCIPIILEKSNNTRITNLIEIFDEDDRTLKIKEILNSFIKKSDSSVVNVNVVTPENLYKNWNNYIRNNTNNIHNIHNNNNTLNTHLFESIKLSNIGGRDLELCIPLLIVSNLFGEQILKETTLTLQKIMEDKKEDSFNENHDIMLIDFVSQLTDDQSFYKLNKVVRLFKEFLQSNDDWINNKWIGRALKRLMLITNKRRVSSGVEVTLDVKKAQNKIKMFRK